MSSYAYEPRSSFLTHKNYLRMATYDPFCQRYRNVPRVPNVLEIRLWNSKARSCSPTQNFLSRKVFCASAASFKLFSAFGLRELNLRLPYKNRQGGRYPFQCSLSLYAERSRNVHYRWSNQCSVCLMYYQLSDLHPSF